jgi:SAM-dependent methyltransferase
MKNRLARYYFAQLYSSVVARTLDGLAVWPLHLYARMFGHVCFPELADSGASALDVGCGSGWLMKKLQEEGWITYGIEPSAEAAARARALTERPVLEGTLPGVELKPESFDFVSFWHVLEHVPSPLATLQQVYECLVPGGCLLIVVPNFASMERRLAGSKWFGLDLPRHLYQFEPRSIERLLKHAGFDVCHYVCFNEPWMLELDILRLVARPPQGLVAQRIVRAICTFVARALSLLGDGSVLVVYCKKPEKQ